MPTRVPGRRHSPRGGVPLRQWNNYIEIQEMIATSDALKRVLTVIFAEAGLEAEIVLREDGDSKCQHNKKHEHDD